MSVYNRLPNMIAVTEYGSCALQHDKTNTYTKASPIIYISTNPKYSFLSSTIINFNWSLDRFDNLFTSCIWTPGACWIALRFSQTCCLMLLRYDLLFIFSCQVNKFKRYQKLQNSCFLFKLVICKVRLTWLYRHITIKLIQDIQKSADVSWYALLLKPTPSGK